MQKCSDGNTRKSRPQREAGFDHHQRSGRLVIAGSASRMESGIQLANEILDSGRGLEKLQRISAFLLGS